MKTTTTTITPQLPISQIREQTLEMYAAVTKWLFEQDPTADEYVKEARKEFVDATKELFGNQNMARAAVHIGRICYIMLLKRLAIHRMYFG